MAHAQSLAPCSGLVAALALHREAPSVGSSIYVETSVIALGFVVGLFLDARREKL